MLFPIPRGGMYRIKNNVNTYYILLSILYLICLYLVIDSRDRQQVWIRLIVNALETNFFLYSSDLSMNVVKAVIHSIEPKTNRLNGIIRHKQQDDIKERYVSGPNDQSELEINDSDSDSDNDNDSDNISNASSDSERGAKDFYEQKFDGSHAVGRQTEYSNSNPCSYNPMMTMDLQSITTAYREGDGCSFGYFSGHTRQVRSIETQAMEQQVLATRNMNAVSDLLVRARNPNGDLNEVSMNEAQKMLIIRAISPVYYMSDRPYGNYQQYRYIQNDQVCDTTIPYLLVYH